MYEYDALYRVVDTKYGVAATPTAGTVGPANQPAAIDFATATAAFRQELKLDLLANRVQFAQTGADPSSLAYGGYDGAAATSYTPDPRCRTASVDDGSGAVAPVWDANGALTDDGVRLYEYDPENRLLGVSPKSPVAGDMRAEYAYDALGRRARRTVEEFDGAAWSPLSETHYFHDGWSVVEEVDGATGAVVAEYLNGRGLDEPLAAVLAGVNGGEPVYFHQDHLGSVELLTDAAGNVLQRYRYDIHGNATVLDANGQPATGNQPPLSPYLFVGRRFDIESGLYYVRNRYYSPLLGKFISPDPLDYVDGMNVYAYVNGNVVNLADPMGLTPTLLEILEAEREQSPMLTGRIDQDIAAEKARLAQPEEDRRRNEEANAARERELHRRQARQAQELAYNQQQLVAMFQLKAQLVSDRRDAKSARLYFWEIGESERAAEFHRLWEEIDGQMALVDKHIRSLSAGCGPYDPMVAAAYHFDMASIRDTSPVSDTMAGILYALSGRWGDASINFASVLIPGALDAGAKLARRAKRANQLLDAVKAADAAGQAGRLADAINSNAKAFNALPAAKQFEYLDYVLKNGGSGDEVLDAATWAGRVTPNSIPAPDGGFSADLTKTKAKSHSGQVNAANKQLHEAMDANPVLRADIEARHGADAFDRTSTSGSGRQNPVNTEWDHSSTNPNALDLRTVENHLQKTVAEGQSGGGWKRFHGNGER